MYLIISSEHSPGKNDHFNSLYPLSHKELTISEGGQGGTVSIGVPQTICDRFSVIKSFPFSVLLPFDFTR